MAQLRTLGLGTGRIKTGLNFSLQTRKERITNPRRGARLCSAAVSQKYKKASLLLVSNLHPKHSRSQTNFTKRFRVIRNPNLFDHGLAKSNSHLYAGPAYEPPALLESAEPTGALVIDTLPFNSVARRGFPLPTNTVAFRTYEQRELERRWADPRRGGNRARGRIIRKEGLEELVLRLCAFFGVPV
jgi:hypothetical protein